MKSAVFAGLTVAVQADVGFEGIVKDSLDEVENVALSFKGGTIPDYVVGTFVQGGPARWTWGSRSFTHILDGFSKLSKYEFSGGNKVKFTAKFPRTGFYTEAEQKNDIPLGVFAQQTDPPLAVTLSEFSKAPNDNNQVNVIQLGDGNLELLSDTLSMVELDQATLELTNEYNGIQCSDNVPDHCTVMQNKSVPLGSMNPGASAHPHFTDDGDYIGLREIAKLMPKITPGKEALSVYRIRKDKRDTIQDMVHLSIPRTSYTHDFGLAKGPDGDHVLVCAQPISYLPMTIAEKGTLKDGFEKTSAPARFFVAPLQFGAKAVEIEAPDTIFFGHQVNAYSTESGKFVFDLNKQHNIFFDRYDMGCMKDKKCRDSWPTTAAGGVIPGYQTVTRYTIDINAKTATSEPLFGHSVEENIYNEFDLFKMHPADYGKPHCGFWAWQAFYQSTSFASWAVVRTELCGDKPKVAAAWHKENVYPGEASFIPKPGSTDKTEGVLVFKAYDGNVDKTSLIVADAHTMETIAEAELPINIPFTVHGNWIPSSSNTVHV